MVSEELTNSLALAYNISIREGRQDEAVAVLRRAIAASDAMRRAATDELQRLDAVIGRRGVRACHLSAVYRALLKKALEE